MMLDHSSADLTDRNTLRQLLRMWWPKFDNAASREKEDEAAGMLAFFGMMMRNVEKIGGR